MPELKDISYVINFEMAKSYGRYKDTVTYVDREDGATITFVAGKDDQDTIAMY